ncbi:cytidylate kinase-like family protein [Aminipila luticellarii]|uniref:Cytidylate kinase-like family protein n=1 Tax=Aminipila luticellarii TaxID=2507160 RepID=A0A410PX97_9FIRM|nr:cytidylate kinase-like family protein [Aminipila luticellarii]QAT43587.1 cytidylate kinase-like family protein [Aminipila luticellarii]
MKQRIVTISRTYGSGGRIIGQKLAEDMGVPFYDKALIDRIAEESGFSKDLIENAEMKAKNSFIYTLATSLGGSGDAGIEGLSLNDKCFLAQVNVIRKIAEEGPCVIVGRCADYILRDMPEVTNIFVCAEMHNRIQRAVEEYGMDKTNVENEIKKIDKARTNYYTHHTGRKWGDILNYHLTLDSGYIGLEDTIAVIEEFLERRKY